MSTPQQVVTHSPFWPMPGTFSREGGKLSFSAQAIKGEKIFAQWSQSQEINILAEVSGEWKEIKKDDLPKELRERNRSAWEKVLSISAFYLSYFDNGDCKLCLYPRLDGGMMRAAAAREALAQDAAYGQLLVSIDQNLGALRPAYLTLLQERLITAGAVVAGAGLGGAVGLGAGFAMGAIMGAATGGSAGTVGFPLIGTIIGAIVGALIGGVGGFAAAYFGTQNARNKANAIKAAFDKAIDCYAISQAALIDGNKEMAEQAALELVEYLRNANFIRDYSQYDLTFNNKSFNELQKTLSREEASNALFTLKLLILATLYSIPLRNRPTDAIIRLLRGLNPQSIERALCDTHAATLGLFFIDRRDYAASIESFERVSEENAELHAFAQATITSIQEAVADGHDLQIEGGQDDV